MHDGKEASFDVVVNGAYVTVAAFTPKMEAILVRQFRPGPEMELVSFPEGYVDPKEKSNPAFAARRELLEETGYETDQFIHLKTFRSAYSDEEQICFLATNCTRVAKQQLDQEEDIEVFTVPLDTFRKLIRDNKDTSLKNVDAAYLALDYLGKLT